MTSLSKTLFPRFLQSALVGVENTPKPLNFVPLELFLHVSVKQRLSYQEQRQSEANADVSGALLNFLEPCENDAQVPITNQEQMCGLSEFTIIDRIFHSSQMLL